jgi:hypothetical protein
VAQVVPQLPQLSGSDTVDTQRPLHSDVPLGQAQVPLLHTWPSAHAWPHWPQLLALVRRSRHWPLQSVVPAGQPHMPALQL